MEKDVSKLPTEELKKELDRIEALKAKKNQLPVLREQKKQEIKETLKKNKKMTKLQKGLLTLGIGAGVALTTRGGVEYITNQKAEKKAPKMENIKGSSAERQLLTLEKLQISLSKRFFEEGINHKDVFDAVNNLVNQESKKAIIDFLYTADITGLQGYLGMKKDSKFALNKATGSIDRNTLKIISGGYFGCRNEEILENPNISEDVKDAYQEFMDGTINNNGQNYLIESKIGMRSYLFDKDHRLIDLQPILIGKDLGKDQEFVPYKRYYEKGVKKYLSKEINTNTPEGLFDIEGIDKLKEKDYSIDGPKEAIILIPIMLTTPRLNYDTKKIKLRIHPIFLPKDDKERYKNALETPEISDNNQSHGCINVVNFGRIKDNLNLDSKNGSRIYITQYNKYQKKISE